MENIFEQLDPEFSDKVVLTKKKFTRTIGDYMSGHPRSTYIDAVLAICEKQGIDPSDIKKLISQQIKDKIEAEAVSSNLVKVKRNSLPI